MARGTKPSPSAFAPYTGLSSSYDSFAFPLRKIVFVFSFAAWPIESFRSILNSVGGAYFYLK